MSKLIGVTGFARSGKDTFFTCGSKYLSAINKTCVRYAFADVLKSECDPLTQKYTGISCFTSNDREKALIRPLLVAYGTYLRRQINPNCWIDSVRSKVQLSLDQGHHVFVTDVRFKNEADWISSEGGLIVNVIRDGIKAANPDEAEQWELIKPLVAATVAWPTFGEDSLRKGSVAVVTALHDILNLEANNEKNFPQTVSS